MQTSAPRQRSLRRASRQTAWPESEAPIVGTCHDGLELAGPVLPVEPREAVGRNPAVGRLGDHVEIGPVRGERLHLPVALGHDTRRSERGAVRLDATDQIAGFTERRRKPAGKIGVGSESSRAASWSDTGSPSLTILGRSALHA